MFIRPHFRRLLDAPASFRFSLRFPASLGGAIIITAAVLSPLTAAQAQSLKVYLSKPQSQTTVYTNTITEDFESLATGNRTTDFTSVIGVYTLNATNRFNIQADNQYGAGTGKYMAIGSQAGSSAPITLTFSGPQQYFGFSWNAGDANNGLTFFNGSILIGRFSTKTLTDLLNNTTVTALDNSIYNSADYKGKPASGSPRQNANEPYAFVNFIASGLTFDRIIFDNSGTTGTGFESDNHTIRATTPTLDTASVFVTGVSNPLAAPEPGSLALLLPSLGGLAVLRRRRGR